MSCTVHSPTDSLVQPTCILVYIECNPAPVRLPIRALFGFTLKQSSPILPSLSESPGVVVCPRFALGHLRATQHVGPYSQFMLEPEQKACGGQLLGNIWQYWMHT